MKFLTLNTHSWMEKEAEEKFQILLQDILDKDYDLICFQEINQEMTSPEVEVNSRTHSSGSLCPTSGRKIG